MLVFIGDFIHHHLNLKYMKHDRQNKLFFTTYKLFYSLKNVSTQDPKSSIFNFFFGFVVLKYSKPLLASIWHINPKIFYPYLYYIIDQIMCFKYFQFNE